MVFTIRSFEFNHWKVLVRDWAGIGTLQDSPEETLRAGNQQVCIEMKSRYSLLRASHE